MIVYEFDLDIKWVDQKTDLIIRVYHVDADNDFILIYEGRVILKGLKLGFKEFIVLRAQKLVVPCANSVYESG